MLTKYFKIKNVLKKSHNKRNTGINFNNFQLKKQCKNEIRNFKLYKEFPIFNKLKFKKSFSFDNDIESDNELIDSDIFTLENNIKKALLEFKEIKTA